MAKNKEAVGLDIGSHSIKIVHLAQNGDGLEIKNYKIVDIQSPEDKFSAIKDALKILQLPQKDVPLVVSVEGVNVFIRVFKLPGVAANKLAKIVQYEAQQQLPFPIDEVAWSYQSLRKVTPEETDVLLCAVKNSIANETLQNIGQDVTNIIPSIVGLNSFLNWNKYESIRTGSDDSVMVLDVGAKTVNVIISEKNSLWFRTIPIGAEVITQGLSNEYGIDISSAEVFKIEKGEILMDGEEDGDADKKRISMSIIKSLTRLTGEISRSIEVYSSNFNSLGPKKIFITGGGAYLKNIANFFNKKFRVETSILRNIKNLSVSGSLNKEKWNKDILKMYAAIGLAVHGLESKFDLTLLPKEIIKQKTLKGFQSYITAAVSMFIFLGICLSAYNFQVERIYKANINKIESEIKSVDGNKLQLMNIQKKLDSVKTTIDIFDNLKNARKFWLEMLLEVENILPQNVWLEKVQTSLSEQDSKNKKNEKETKNQIKDYSRYTAGTIDIKIAGKTTGTYQDIVVFNDLLNKSVYFINGSGKVASANPPEGGVRDFVIEIRANVAGE
jgi:type IV pilus assembly protein PilM